MDVARSRHSKKARGGFGGAGEGAAAEELDVRGIGEDCAEIEGAQAVGERAQGFIAAEEANSIDAGLLLSAR